MRSAALVLAVIAISLGAPEAGVAAAPVLGHPWAAEIDAGSARLHGSVNPNGIVTTYRFDFIPAVAYEANLAASRDGFFNAQRTPKVEASAGAGSVALAVEQTANGLVPETSYVYRLRALSSEGVFTTETERFITQPLGGAGPLADSRAWELVSPLNKNGGQIDAPGTILGGGYQQAAGQGGAITFSSAASFAGGSGAPPASQYLAVRGAAGWTTQNLTVPLFAGTFGVAPEGVPYRIFSADLGRGLLLNGQHCRGEAVGCPVANPPLPGTAAPAGYQNFYLREGGGFTAILTAADVAHNLLEPRRFEIGFGGASPDLRHLVLSSCAALTAEATEVPLGDGCDPAKQNLYIWSATGGLELVNIPPAQAEGVPGSRLAAPMGAVSRDGLRVYWNAGADLFLREGAVTRVVDSGGGAVFQIASADGSVAYFTKAGHLWRYAAATGNATDLTPAGAVLGVLGASAEGESVYYLTGSGLYLWREGDVTEVAATADPSTYPPATGTARVSADGDQLLFTSTAALTGYDNTDARTGMPDRQVYLYDADRNELSCLSCNPTNGRPTGPSGLPGPLANGAGPGATISAKPRALIGGGSRVFFESEDALVATDTNGEIDVYEWAAGSGGCVKPEGCLSLISSGRAAGGAAFVDASSDGTDAFFLTDGSLVSADTGSVDLYDARVGGGFPEPETDIPCEGNACQALTSAPVDPPLNTQLPGLGNPRVRYLGGKRCRKGKVRRGGKCVKKDGRKGKRR